MYLKFITRTGQVVRYNEIKKRIVLGMVRDYDVFSNKKLKIQVDKSSIDVTNEIKLLYNILTTYFNSDYYKFESVYANANIYVSNVQQKDCKNILVLFGSLFLDLTNHQFYSISIINGNVLLSNAVPVDIPYYYNY